MSRNFTTAFSTFIVDTPIKPDGAQNEDKTRLQNHWTPLRRLLHAGARRFHQTIADAPDWEKFIRSGKPPQDFASAAKRARNAEVNNDWLSALEHWASARNSDDKPNRYQALIGQALALEALGETFLSERLLRSAFYHEDDASNQEQAFELLLERTQGASSKLNLLAAAAIRQPDANLLVQLIEALIENGHYQAALDLGVVIPAPQRPLELLSRAAYVQQNWRIMDYLLSLATDSETVSYWRGYQAQYHGEYDIALQHWAKAGQRGARLTEFLRKGIAIHDTLGLDKESLDAWQRWQTEHPGHHRWVRDDTLITRSAGAVMTYAIESDAYGRMYHGTPQQPGVIKVYGPARLRINARLAYSGQVSDFTDDWLLVRVNNELQRVAINRDLPVNGLRVVSADEFKLGRLTAFELNVGPGEHEIRVSALNTPLWFDVRVWRPELPLNVLPPITAAAMDSFTENRKTISAGEFERVQFIQNCALVDAKDLSRRYQANTDLAQSREQVSQWLAAPRGVSLWSHNTPERDAVRQLNDIVWQAEQNEERWSDYLALGEQLFQQNLTIKELNPLISRLRRLTAAQWHTLTNIEQDAGVHIADIPGWQPESPSLRVRKALMGPVWDEERVVTGGKQLGLSFINTGATALNLSLTSMDIAFLPRYPMTINYGVGDSAKNSARLSPQDSKRDVKVTIPGGSHNLRVGIEQPYANQYVKVGVRQQGQVLAEPSSRLYHVATHETPVQFSVKGPAWLRIDENRSGHYDLSLRIRATGLATHGVKTVRR